MRRWWIGPLVILPVLVALIIAPASRRTLRAEEKDTLRGESSDPLALVRGTRAAPVAGLDVFKMSVDDAGALAPLPDGKVARLFVDPALQKTALGLMANHHIPEAAVVMIDVQTGHVLAYASHVEKGPPRDLCVEATAPAASVFKIVTGGALVEVAGVSPEVRECYSGGEQRITPQDLEPNPARDRWCTTLGGAMGRSINTVFARLALRNLKAPQLDEFARSLGFGSPIAFDVPVQASAVKMPDDPIGFARSAAGFWNTTLSPIHAAMLSVTVARGGEVIRPELVSEVRDASGEATWTSRGVQVLRRAMKAETSVALTGMMNRTVSDGTSYRAFHDTKRTSFLPGMEIAGKTGTLTDAEKQRYYTWFTGFAPSRAEAGQRQVAIAVLVVNQPVWHIKANVLARDMLRAFFAGQKTPGVTPPSMRVAATRPSKAPPPTFD